MAVIFKGVTKFKNFQLADRALTGTPYESTAYIIDGYGVSLATHYGASRSNRDFLFHINADTGSTDLTGDTYEGAIRGRLVIGTTQTNASLMGVVGSIDVGDGVDIQGNYFGLDAVLDFYGDSTVGSGASSHNGAIRGTIWNEGTTTLGAGAVLAGINLYQVSGKPTLGSGAINAGVYIRADASSHAWGYGIYILSGMATVAMAAFAPVNIAITQTSATPGTSRAIYGKQTSHTSMTSGNLVGVRGEVTVGGSVSTGVYLYGAQGKLIGGSNTITAGNGMVCGVYGQIDVTGTTLASGWISAIHADIYGATSGSYAMNLISATHAGGGVINALLSLYGKSDYVFDISSNTHNNVAIAGTVTDDDGYIKVLVDGEVRYIGLGSAVA